MKKKKKLLSSYRAATRRISGWANDKETEKRVSYARKFTPPVMIQQPKPQPMPIIPPPQKRCSRCGAPLIINDGGYGTYFECGTCGYIGG